MIITIIPATFSKYLFIKNNYNKLTRINVIAVLFPFAIKFITYQIMKFNELEKYVIVFIITEAILFIILLIMSNNYKKRAIQHEFI
jgi:Mn2+/Fe2+ NRAMP family transporter